MRQRNCIPACAAAAAAAIVFAAAPAQSQTPAPATPAAEARPAEAATHSLRAVRDKATGRLRAPTADELEAMQARERGQRQARGQSGAVQTEPLRTQLHANGMRSAVLGPDYLITLKGERRADGSVHRFHPDEQHAHPVRDNRPTE